jgi:precorrin-8X/cobalt-precorrin-8 methylmutase
MIDYLKDPAAIYQASFATIRHEARLDSLPANAHGVAIRIIHACGMPDVAADLRITPDFVDAACAALKAGKPVLTDAEMVRQGIIAKAVPVICRLNDPAARAIGLREHTTRSAAAVDLWREDLAGAVVVIGNAPTALFHLLERIDSGWPKPAAIAAFPVGFVGAAESKEELFNHPRGLPFATLLGRRGGSAMAAAVVNALAAGQA